MMVERDILDRKHLLLAMQEISTAQAGLVDLMMMADLTVLSTRQAKIYAMLDKAMARIARAGTGKDYTDLIATNPHEQACRALTFYATKWESEEGSRVISEELVVDGGQRAKDWLEKYAVPLHSDDAAATMAQAATI
jgi:hypothetical protein